MNSSVAGSPAEMIRTAITVMNSSAEPMLSAFFGKCDGILIVDTAGAIREFYRNELRTPAALCDLILLTKPDRLVCGYVSEAEKQTLCDAGIDVRLGSCNHSINELSACFCDLPKA